MSAAATPAATPALEMRDVTVTSLNDPEAVVLEGVNWSVSAGDYWVIGGLHRSGKSDLMALAAGLMLPERGTYRVFGHELTAGFEHEILAARLRIGLVFDGGRLLSHLTVAENIALPLRYHKNLAMPEATRAVEALVDFAGLDSFADANPGATSRNWQQRAGLARALALRPEVLLLDNPLTGLDPRDAAWWLDRLDELSAGHALTGGRPLTLVATGDDLRPWRDRARQFALLREGHFVQLGARPALDASTEPLLQELLRLETAKP